MTRWKIDQLYIEPALIEHSLSSLEQMLYDPSRITEILELSQQINTQLRQLSSYVYCRLSQDTEDDAVFVLQDKTLALKARFSALTLDIDELLVSSGQNFTTFALIERCHLAKKRRPLREEKLAEKLSINGFHGWTHLYDALIASIKIPFQEETLSFGQMENKLDDSNRHIRQTAFFALHQAFDEKKALFARALNHLGGFRLQNDQDRGYSYLQEALEQNRLQQPSLDTMWQVVEAHKQPLFDYLDHKARTLGLSKLSWYDLEAPLYEAAPPISYEEGTRLILKHFHEFSPDMATFAGRAFTHHWIDAEDRPKKRPGGFCTEFPLSKETRIFMTYAGSYTNLLTLAHELGHAYHSHIIFDLPTLDQDYRMSVAETASTMAETILMSASIKEASSPEEKLRLLDEKIRRSVTYLLNIHARFLFEKAFYEERAQGYVVPERLEALMLKAQQEAFGNRLETYHPLFWASKMHFFFSESAFYNFPYTFGYLLSLGIHELINSPAAYRELLKDTGCMTVEELIQKHLGYDLREPLFWERAVQSAVADIPLYTETTSRTGIPSPRRNSGS